MVFRPHRVQYAKVRSLSSLMSSSLFSNVHVHIACKLTLPQCASVAWQDRYPQWSAGGMLRAGDYFGTVCFAMTGTLTAAAHGLDFLGGPHRHPSPRSEHTYSTACATHASVRRVEQMHSSGKRRRRRRELLLCCSRRRRRLRSASCGPRDEHRP